VLQGEIRFELRRHHFLPCNLRIAHPSSSKTLSVHIRRSWAWRKLAGTRFSFGRVALS
jgi:hypothetical protein